MRDRVLRSFAGFLLLLAGAALPLLLSGCGEEGADRAALAPSPAGSGDPAFLTRVDSPAAVPLGKGGKGNTPAGATTSVTAVLGNSGGTLSLKGLEVRVPPGGVWNHTTVTLTLLDPERMTFRVGPAEVEFRKPFEIRVPKLDRDTDAARYGLAWFFRQEGDLWAPVSTHFSVVSVHASAEAPGVFALRAVTLDGQPIEFVRWLHGPGFATKLVPAFTGGLVQYDRYKVIVPSGALAEDTYITVRDPGGAYVECQLEPHGLQFLVPVRLKIKLDDFGYDASAPWTIFWLNEDLGAWEDQSGSWDTGESSVWVDLWHFSAYRPGRAGW